MAEKERGGKHIDKTLNVTGTFKLASVQVTASAADLNTLTGASVEAATKTQGGTVSITGTGTVASTLATITSVVACLGVNSSANANEVTATWSGQTITFAVWKPTSNSNPVPIASTTATAVNYVVVGT